MYIIVPVIVAFLFLCGCNEAATQNTNTSDSANSTPGSSDDRWSFAIEGLPKIEGSAIVRMGMGNKVNYTMGSSDVTIQVSMRGSADRTSMNFKFVEAGIYCVKNRETVLDLGDDRAVVSGKVGCRSADANPSDHNWDSTSIDGWFDLND